MRTIPQIDDPIWVKLVLADRLPELSYLPTRMLLSRVRLVMKDYSELSLQNSVQEIHEFFERNKRILVKDIEILLAVGN